MTSFEFFTLYMVLFKILPKNILNIIANYHKRNIDNFWQNLFTKSANKTYFDGFKLKDKPEEHLYKIYKPISISINQLNTFNDYFNINVKKMILPYIVIDKNIFKYVNVITQKNIILWDFLNEDDNFNVDKKESLKLLYLIQGNRDFSSLELKNDHDGYSYCSRTDICHSFTNHVAYDASEDKMKKIETLKNQMKKLERLKNRK
jgi:hypothetical protein